MGIGNDATGRHERPHLHLITPHGDWKRGISPPARGAPAPHYPSWGLETRTVARLARDESPHYPSWGLETERPTAAELFTHTSLPLMGIGNTKPVFMPGVTPFSLPLMGIGNLEVAAGQTLEAASLPLMGIGNTALLWSVVTPKNSLPLMGIGNVETRQRADGEVDSLPLMGIGNIGWSSRRMASTCSHYPSWGLETLDNGASSDGGATSLPLMGIGNNSRTLVCSPSGISLPLMGIGNASTGGDCTPTSRTHYPSWGLETHALCNPSLPASSSSLPLMGIGNFTTFSTWPRHPGSSLPLMGIGNGTRSKRPSNGSRLITPHGDWKPSKHQQFTISRLLPAHADGQAFVPSSALGPPTESGCLLGRMHDTTSDHRPVLAMPYVRLLTHLPTQLLLGESDDTDVVAVLAG